MQNTPVESLKDISEIKKVDVMEWPVQSPDINPIENLKVELLNRLTNDRKPNNEK